MKAKTPKTPKVADPVPVPQADDPGLVDVKRRTAAAAGEREGMRSSLLTPGVAKGTTGSGDTTRRRLGFGSMASGSY